MNKTKEQPIEEIEALRQRIAELEKSEAKRKREKTQSVNMITAGWYGEATYD